MVPSLNSNKLKIHFRRVEISMALRILCSMMSIGTSRRSCSFEKQSEKELDFDYHAKSNAEMRELKPLRVDLYRRKLLEWFSHSARNNFLDLIQSKVVFCYSSCKKTLLMMKLSSTMSIFFPPCFGKLNLEIASRRR